MRTVVLAIPLVFVVACGAGGGGHEPAVDDDSGADARSDAAVTVDAGGRVDAGGDASTVRDAGADTGLPLRDASADASSSDLDASGDARADTGAPPDASTPDDAGASPCEPGGSGRASDDDAGSTTATSGYGDVNINVASSNQIVFFQTTLTVPVEPPGGLGTLFLWPGLQPDGANFDTLNNGVLQPVLTWGGTCAPMAPSDPYASWWVSGQYVNTYIQPSSPNYAAYNGCHGGPGMDVQTGDALLMTMQLDGMNWVQTVADSRSGQQVSYTLDMLGQAQTWAEFVIEPYSRPPTADVVFTSTTVTFASPERSACQPTSRGEDDYFAQPLSSADGRTCCVSRIVLRGQGVAATTPNGP